MAISLVRAAPVTGPSGPETTFTEIREVKSEELREIEEAIAFSRTYARRYTVQLVFTGRATFDQALAKLHQPLPGTAAQVVAGEVEVALVSFLLMWRLFLDQTCHDLSQRFGKQSPTCDRFVNATHAAYDAHPGYRLVEGLRNYVQHAAMPGLKHSASRRQGNAGEPAVVTAVTVTLPREKLLEYLRNRGGQRILRQDLEAGTGPLPIIDLVDDAMQGFEELVRVLTDIDMPDLTRYLARIQGLVDEAAPGVPVVADLDTFTQAGGPLTMTRFDDLFEFLPLVHTGQ